MALIAHPAEVVKKEDLMRIVWPDSYVEDNGLARNIAQVRKALGEGPKDSHYIETIPTLGYRFVATVRKHKFVAPEPEAETLRPDPNADFQCHKTEKPFEKTGLDAKGDLSWFARAWEFRIRGRMWLLPIPVLAIVLWMWRPSIARVYNNSGVSFQQHGEVTTAIANYQRALALSPGYAEAHYNLADAYEELSDYDKAIEEYKRAIQADDSFYQAYNNLSRIYILRRDYATALGLLDRALNLQPREPSVRYSLYKNHGWANFGLSLFGQAERDLRRALDLGQNRGAAHCLLAMVLEAHGEGNTALREWESCLAYGSGERDVEPSWRSRAQETLRREGQNR
jgi:tetratricopeptide (TPR) repeat protein